MWFQALDFSVSRTAVVKSLFSAVERAGGTQEELLLYTLTRTHTDEENMLRCSLAALSQSTLSRPAHYVRYVGERKRRCLACFYWRKREHASRNGVRHIVRPSSSFYSREKKHFRISPLFKSNGFCGWNQLSRVEHGQTDHARTSP